MSLGVASVSIVQPCGAVEESFPYVGEQTLCLHGGIYNRLYTRPFKMLHGHEPAKRYILLYSASLRVCCTDFVSTHCHNYDVVRSDCEYASMSMPRRPKQSQYSDAVLFIGVTVSSRCGAL